MKIRSCVYVATSLDGFIARKNGDVGWLNDAQATIPKGEDCGFGEFMASIDTLIMGRKTFDTVLSFDCDWPYGNTPVIVLSRHTSYVPPELTDTVTVSKESPTALVKRLENEGAKRLYIDGATTVQRFIKEGQLQELTITAIPILLGDGIPLFGKQKKDIQLELLRTKTYDCGFVQSTYAINR